jgi:hypothetical protein
MKIDSMHVEEPWWGLIGSQEYTYNLGFCLLNRFPVTIIIIFLELVYVEVCWRLFLKYFYLKIY